MTDQLTAEMSQPTLTDAEIKARAIDLEQCSLFVDSKPLVKAMTDGAATLRALLRDRQQRREQQGVVPDGWLLSAGVTKREGSLVTYSHVAGARFGVSENEARGAFVKSVQELKPGFAIDEIICNPLRIPAAAPSPPAQETENG